MAILGKYDWQIVELRKIAIKALGTNVVATMLDDDVYTYIEDNFIILWGDSITGHHHIADDDRIILIPAELLSVVESKIILVK